MALFSVSGVLRGFPAATYLMYASPQTLVRPCPSKKLLISELETHASAQFLPGRQWMGTRLGSGGLCMFLLVPLGAPLGHTKGLVFSSKPDIVP